MKSPKVRIGGPSRMQRKSWDVQNLLTRHIIWSFSLGTVANEGFDGEH